MDTGTELKPSARERIAGPAPADLDSDDIERQWFAILDETATSTQGET
jgi:hypothetical protein